jgi:hypothetical protein
MRTEKELADYLHDAIKKDYLLTILVTSQTQAKRKSQNLPFGLGKTTLAFWLSYYMNHENWEIVFDFLAGNPYDVVNLLEPNSKRKNCVVWDAVQMTAPAEQGVPRVIRRMASYVSDTRPEIACLVMTASNINAISSPLRKLVVFEAIVSERGEYEIQKISYHKNFKQPLLDLSKLDYMEEGKFPKLPPEIYSRYEKWRVQSKMKIYPQLKASVMEYVKMTDPFEALTFTAPVIRASNRYVIEVPKALGEKLHKQHISVELKSP